ncbi:MAG: uracil-DNA glycosylase, partial [Ilumatobacteraceae bacterium]|nr:uracil-DNA glycosylase [Ilumatobacteraceae bacterium]
FRAMHTAGLASQPTSQQRNDGLTLRDAWVTVAVRCAPPDNKPLPLERKRCAGFLDRELTMLTNKQVVVCLGGFAYVAACEYFAVSPRPKFAHGLVVPAGDVTLVCSYHPSQQNTFTGRLTESMLDDVFTRALQLAGKRSKKSPARG